MTSEDIKKALVEAHSAPSNTLVEISGYVTGTGSVYDYVLYHALGDGWRAGLEDDGSEKTTTPSVYYDLLRLSLEEAKADRIEVTKADLAKYDVSKEALEEARQKYIGSWTRSLAPRDSAVDTKEEVKINRRLVYVPEGAYWADSEDPGLFILLHRVSKKATKVSEGDKSKVSRAGLNSKNEAVRASNLYLRSSPMDCYVPRLNLRTGKVGSIRVLTP